MTLGLYALLGTAAVGLLYWFPVRSWYRRADARRIDAARAMSGDIDILVPDYESTLAISVAAPPPAVWDALVRFGWPRTGRALYEWLGRTFGFLEPQASACDAEHLPVGRRSQVHVRSADPSRALVVGGNTSRRQWAWQFEICPLDERRTRVILRDRARASSMLPAWLLLAVPRALSYVLTRKMLLDIKMTAEAAAR